MIEAKEGQSFWRYGAVVYGIKKRCRKPDTHVSVDSNGEDLKEITGTPNREEAIPLAKEWASKNMKTVSRITATASFWTQENNGCTVQWQPFNDAHNLKWEVEL